jgi:Predicted transcriptional regulators
VNQIKKYRKENNLSQEELADILQVSQGTVCQWETGMTNPRIPLLPIIAELFNCTIDDLIGDEIA